MAEPAIGILILTRVLALKDLQVEIVKKISTIVNSHPAKMEVTVLMASMAFPVFVPPLEVLMLLCLLWLGGHKRP